MIKKKIRKSADNAMATFLAIDEDINPLILILNFRSTKIVHDFLLKKYRSWFPCFEKCILFMS
jgi:hypothetical protein